MSKPIKTLLTAIGMFFILSIVYYFSFGGNPEGLRVEMEEAYAAGDLQSAEESLSKLRTSVSKVRYLIDQSYILRTQGNLKESDRNLFEALELVGYQSDSQEAFEIYLNQMLNAYLEGNYNRLKNLLQRAGQIQEGNNSWISLYDGILALQEEQYAQALNDWRLVQERTYLNPMMETSFNQTFTPEWIEIQEIRGLMGAGELFQARQRIQKMQRAASGDLANRLNSLLGETYIAEAKGKSEAAALPYYRLAFTNFEKIPLNEPQYEETKTKLLKLITENTQNSLMGGQYSNLTFYVELLQRWDAKEQLQIVAKQISEALFQQVQMGEWQNVAQLVQVLKGVLPEGELSESIMAQLDTQSKQALDEGDLSSLLGLWRALRTLSPDTEKYDREYFNNLTAKIKVMAQDEKTPDQKIQNHLQFWTQIVSDPQEKVRFVNELLALAQRLWIEENKKDRASFLIIQAQNIPTPEMRTHYQQGVKNVIQKLYDNLAREEKLDDFDYLLRIVNALNLGDVKIGNKEDAVKQLKQAEELFAEGELDQAKLKASWVLLVDPQNQKAMRLMGLIAYQESQFSEALEYLRQIELLDSKMIQALAVSELLAGEPNEGMLLLGRIEEVEPLTQDQILQIAYGALTTDHPSQALYWFGKAAEVNNPLILGRSYAFYEMGKWNNVINELERLSPPWNQSDLARGLEILTLMNQKDAKGAGIKLEEWLKKGSTPLPTEGPVAFKNFEEETRGVFNPNAIASIYYLDVENNPEKALTFLVDEEDPTIETLIRRSEVYRALGEYDKAEADLLKAFEKSRFLSDRSPLKDQVLYQLGKFYASVGKDETAFGYLQKYVANNPLSFPGRKLFATVLRNVRRYDLAGSQYLYLIEKQALDEEDYVPYFETLIYTNQFEQARELISRWLGGDKEPSLLAQLRLVPLLNVLRDEFESKTIFGIANANDQRTVDENIAYLKALLIYARYQEAEKLIEVAREEIESEAEGLLQLAIFSLIKNDYEGAMVDAYRAQALDPANRDVKAFIYRYEKRTKVLEQRLADLQEQKNVNPEDISHRLAIADTLLTLGVEKYAGKEVDKKDQLKEVVNATALLRTLADEYGMFPEIFKLLGQGEYLLDNQMTAFNVLSRALKIDVSNVDVYQLLALIYQRIGKEKRAQLMLYQAVKYEPQNARIWLMLSASMQREGNTLDAIQYLRNAIRYQPYNVKSYIQLAQMLLDLNNPQSVIETLQLVLQFEPKNEEALAMMLETLANPNYYFGNYSPLTRDRLKEEVYAKLQEVNPQRADAIKKRFQVEDSNFTP